MKKKCLHCGYQWTPRIETEPKACPKCKSPRWNEEKRRAGRPKQNRRSPISLVQFSASSISREHGRQKPFNRRRHSLHSRTGGKK